MLQLPKRPYLTWEQIAGKADGFADEYHLAERSYPLDIEEIAEFDLGIELRIVAGVHDECGTPAQIGLCSDRLIISVDANQYNNQTSFYRYSLAHEIAHWVLHREWLLAYWKTIDSIARWKQDLALISEEDYNWLESPISGKPRSSLQKHQLTAKGRGFAGNELEMMVTMNEFKAD
ncbi:MAG: hypothetical protein NTX71_02335 [Candidatus Aureabacteria bacterium]|nr:hypothetical protein [Candidatus Auribacterota bacterium]